MQHYRTVDKGGHSVKYPISEKEVAKTEPKDEPKPLTAADVDRMISEALQKFARQFKA